MNTGFGQFFFVVLLMITLSDAIPGHRLLICYVVVVWTLLFKLLDYMEARGKEKREAKLEYFSILVSHGMPPSEALEMAGMDKEYTVDNDGRIMPIPEDSYID